MKKYISIKLKLFFGFIMMSIIMLTLFLLMINLSLDSINTYIRNSLLTKEIELVDTLINQILSNVKKFKYILFLFTSIFFTIQALFVILYTGHFLKPIKYLINFFKEMSEEKADLTKKLEVKSKDEIGLLAIYFNASIKKLNQNILTLANAINSLLIIAKDSSDVIETGLVKNTEIIKKNIQKIESQIANSTSGIEELTATVEEIARNIESITKNMERQASAVEESASSIEEMVRNIENTTNMSEKSKNISINLDNVASEGKDIVQKTIASIKEVSEYSQQILKLLQLITNIAKQTNLLAMNAAIEAAHAGEAGKGFAIVADEIRRLSEDTNKNARDISEVVNTIVNRISETVKLAEKAGEGLETITKNSKLNQELINQLSITMEEQNHGAKEILNAIQELVKITEEVKLSMIEQKNATDDFREALHEIQELTIENQESINEHINSLNQLIESQEKIKNLVFSGRDKSIEIENLVLNFKLEKEEEIQETGLRLVE